MTFKEKKDDLHIHFSVIYRMGYIYHMYRSRSVYICAHICICLIGIYIYIYIYVYVCTYVTHTHTHTQWFLMSFLTCCYQHHLGTCQACKFPDPTPDLLNEKLAIYMLTSPPDDSDVRVGEELLLHCIIKFYPR